MAATRGDGLGCDIEYSNRDGSARVIEVKTMGLGKQGNFASAPRMYPLTGALDQVCRLEQQSFVARV